MALSNAERQRRKREKAKAELDKKPDLSQRFIQGSFAAFFANDTDNGEDGGDWRAVEELFDYVGIELPDLTKDEWLEFEQFNLAAFEFQNSGALGRAELLASAFQDGLRVLAEKINRFKQAELAARFEEFKTRDLADQDARLQAVEENTTLRLVSSRLQRTARLTYPEYEIKG